MSQILTYSLFWVLPLNMWMLFRIALTQSLILKDIYFESSKIY